MAHKTLVGGTAYNIVSGKTVVGGVSYNIKGGRTLVGGTGYDISLERNAYAMLYDNGDFSFQFGNKVESGKTLTNSYTGFANVAYSIVNMVPWSSKKPDIKSVYFRHAIGVDNLSCWFDT